MTFTCEAISSRSRPRLASQSGAATVTDPAIAFKTAGTFLGGQPDTKEYPLRQTHGRATENNAVEGLLAHPFSCSRAAQTTACSCLPNPSCLQLHLRLAGRGAGVAGQNIGGGASSSPKAWQTNGASCAKLLNLESNADTLLSSYNERSQGSHKH